MLTFGEWTQLFNSEFCQINDLRNPKVRSLLVPAEGELPAGDRVLALAAPRVLVKEVPVRAAVQLVRKEFPGKHLLKKHGRKIIRKYKP